MEAVEQVQTKAVATSVYAPSPVDRFMRAIEALPISYWITYSIFFFLESLINHILAWATGWMPWFKFDALLLLFPLWQWITLAIVTYLNKSSIYSLERFKPLLNLDDDEYETLKYKFTTMPSRGMVLSGLIWVVIYALVTYALYNAFYVQYGLGNLLKALIILEGLFSFSIGSVIYFHSMRQLWLVDRTVKKVKKFNLFQLNPVYAFSHLTARTGIAWMFMLGLTLLMFPLSLARGWIWFMLGLQFLLAVAAFFLPLQSVNHYLVMEKRRLLADHYLRVEALLKQMHTHLDQKDLAEMSQHNYALSALNSEREVLGRIPTLPWSTGTLTGFLSAIGVPIILLLIQTVLRKLLGG